MQADAVSPHSSSILHTQLNFSPQFLKPSPPQHKEANSLTAADAVVAVAQSLLRRCRWRCQAQLFLQDKEDKQEQQKERGRVTKWEGKAMKLNMVCNQNSALKINKEDVGKKKRRQKNPQCSRTRRRRRRV